MSLLNLISYLLEYPDQTLLTHRDELLAESQQLTEVPAGHRIAITGFIETLSSRPLLDIQAEYGELFDRGRATSLLLFEHVHGESRDRGQAMVDLLAQYQHDGLLPVSKELPDYLPLYLEYLAHSSREKAQQGLEDIVPILALLASRLEQRQSPYAALFAALLAFAGQQQVSEHLMQQVAQEARDDTPAALDAVWEEEQVTFLGKQGCSSAQQTRHQRRFVDNVIPHYLDIAETTTRTTGG
ncbi:MAG: Nitrate reductase molybdenum cofactor assembly chaperone NarJ [Candidatus Erwinia impunctatus]|nr:Nitrate reductase molybdenum cofactor assembly chaperone NarJ [Culicoides impunctatus]